MTAAPRQITRQRPAPAHTAAATATNLPVPVVQPPPRISGRDGYSLFVTLMKVLLPALAVGLILLMVVWPQLRPDTDKFRIGVAKISLEQAESLSMLNPRFEGIDDKNQPFNVTADLATQETGDSQIVDLDRPKADISMEDGTWLAVMAKAGRYDRTASTIDLNGEVVLFHDRGFEVQTPVAHVDLDAGVAVGDQPVRGQGPLGTIDSEGFRIEDRGARVFFTGQSRMTIYPASAKEYDGPSG